jgi:hypothetical protein
MYPESLEKGLQLPDTEIRWCAAAEVDKPNLALLQTRELTDNLNLLG